MKFEKFGIWIITVYLTSYLWIGLEYTLDGQVISQKSDTVFVILLCYLIADKIYCKYFRRRNMTIKVAIEELEKSVKTLRKLLVTENEEDKIVLLNRPEATEIALDLMRREEKCY